MERARKMKGRREKNDLGPGLSSHFSKVKSLGQGWRREKNKGCTISSHWLPFQQRFQKSS